MKRQSLWAFIHGDKLMKVLGKDFYARNTPKVAKDLLGCFLVRKFQGGKIEKGEIVEVEAYLGPKDLASHSSRGKTERTKVMFGPPGRAYIYLIYGIHYMFNIVTGRGEAVLIRALEPQNGNEEIASGPGKLTRYLKIDKHFNNWDLTKRKKLWLEEGERSDFEIKEAKRIGVSYAEEWADKKLRFFIKGNSSVSKS